MQTSRRNDQTRFWLATAAVIIFILLIVALNALAPGFLPRLPGDRQPPGLPVPLWPPVPSKIECRHAWMAV